MSRALIVWTCCAILALLGIVGAHGHHLSHPQGGSDSHTHFSVFDPSHLALGGADHERDHAEHGAVDVDPPAKVFSKTPLLKADLFVLAWVGFLFLLIRLVSHQLRLTPPDKPPGHRWHPYSLPPAHAPPRTA